MNNFWRMMLIMIFSALLVTILVIVVFYFAILQPHQWAAVPELVGMTPEQAQMLVKPATFHLKIMGEEPNEETPAGIILRQEPQPNVAILKGGSVSIWVSQGAERFIVPELAGLTLDRAKNKLEALGLTVGGVDSAFSDSLPQGVVAGTKPRAGVLVKKGNGVVITLSQGPEEAVVPDLIGKRLEAAKSILAELGFVTGKITSRVSTEYSPGRVIGQKPAAGTNLAKGDTVALTIATVLE
jgi:serine/threonine-protein kinase